MSWWSRRRPRWYEGSRYWPIQFGRGGYPFEFIKQIKLLLPHWFRYLIEWERPVDKVFCVVDGHNDMRRRDVRRNKSWWERNQINER